MIRKCWNRIVFHSSDNRILQAPYVPRKIRSRMNWLIVSSAIASISIFYMAAMSVFGQVPQADLATKFADAVEHKSPSWLIAMTAIIATGANIWLVKVGIQLMKDSIGAYAEVKKELVILKALFRGRKVDDETPER